jgi:hypothetical protein
MQKSKFLTVILALALSTLGCSLFSPGAPTLRPPTPSQVSPTEVGPTEVPTAAPTDTLVPTKPPAPTASRLTAEQLKNAEYYLPQYDRTVKLANGSYEAGSGADYISTTLLTTLAFGDLNGDGVDDAAVLLAENGGGSGVFVSVIVMLNQNGQPAQSSSALIDDRPQINGLSIENGQITVAATIHGPSDPGCCPNFPVSETYAWTPTQLELVRFSSKTPTGIERELHLDLPVPDTEASSFLQVQGSFTISPFENTLTYRLVDEQDHPLAEGPITAKSEGVGGPGTFAATIDLAGMPSGSAVRLEIFDLSAADGSTLAMDSVLVTIK